MNRISPMFRLPWNAVCWMALAAGMFFFTGLNAADRLRLDDVFYVDDYLEKPVELKVLRATSLTFSRDGSSLLDAVRAGQHVRLIGIGKDRYLVKAQTLNGRLEGWALMSDLEPIPEAIGKELEQKSKEAEKLKQAIARNEIEIGMPQDAVTKILGKPKAKSSVKDANGSFEQWTYTSYKSVPFYVPSNFNGTNVVSTLYRKMPVGSRVITFQEKKVIRIETKQDDATPSQGGAVVVPPGYVQ